MSVAAIRRGITVLLHVLWAGKLYFFHPREQRLALHQFSRIVFSAASTRRREAMGVFITFSARAP